MNQQLKFIGKFWFPALCILVGILLLYLGFGQGDDMKQSNLALAGTLSILFIGILSALFLLDILPKTVVMVLALLFTGGAVFFGMKNVETVDNELKYIAKKNLIKSQMIQRMKDVRTAELAYLDVHGVYTGNWNELKDFVKNGKISTVKQIGEIPDSIDGGIDEALAMGIVQTRPAGMSDKQIKDSGILVLDTIYENAQKVLFESPKALKKRKHPLDLDKLDIAPGTDDVVLILKADSISVSGGVMRPVFLCEDAKPFAEDTLKVGSLNQAITNGNWKE